MSNRYPQSIGACLIKLAKSCNTDETTFTYIYFTRFSNFKYYFPSKSLHPTTAVANTPRKIPPKCSKFLATPHRDHPEVDKARKRDMGWAE